MGYIFQPHNYCIEGIPLITRFKTTMTILSWGFVLCIEGIPLITRFKTN